MGTVRPNLLYAPMPDITTRDLDLENMFQSLQHTSLSRWISNIPRILQGAIDELLWSKRMYPRTTNPISYFVDYRLLCSGS